MVVVTKGCNGRARNNDAAASSSFARMISQPIHSLQSSVDVEEKRTFPSSSRMRSDIGAGVSVELAHQFPERLMGVHLNLLPWPQPTAKDKTSEVEAWLVEGQRYMEREFDYLRMQTNKPLTPAVALVDSPLGTAAWIAERFWSWSDHNGNLDSIISKDTLLTNVMLYLLGPGGIDGSFWFYRAIRDELRWNFHRGFVRVPTASARFPREYPMGRIPETLARRAYCQ
jgi:hypothetical protein